MYEQRLTIRGRAVLAAALSATASQPTPPTVSVWSQVVSGYMIQY